MEEKLNIQEFREFLEIVRESYDDEQLDTILKTCINSLWIMYEQGYDMPKKALIELKKHL
ncbi:MAG: hypothetical protein GOVbin212_26 [Prokaryotic dsDNA virus sp.]|nr:MAG: hypothetical protein GOVbin212_26 [Prokaryotic dsDNA virus sp.]|tara:strand:- start:13915 stop:14094 length:180 start_codon:yes stop_codon:yes gene_type:complete